MTQLEVCIPFSGFDNSMWSQEIEHIEERESENYADDVQGPDGDNVPKELKLEQSEFNEIIINITDYGALHTAIAKDYCSCFANALEEACGFEVALTFKERDSPRYYNYATDRIFAEISLGDAARLLLHVLADEKGTIQKVLDDKFTSRSGFISYYDTDLDKWLEKPLDQWDHNELGALIEAALLIDEPHQVDVEWSIYETMTNGDVSYRLWSEAVDWDKFEIKVREAREEKMNALAEDDPEAYAELCAEREAREEKMNALAEDDPEAYAELCAEREARELRCPNTIDMFDEYLPRLAA